LKEGNSWQNKYQVHSRRNVFFNLYSTLRAECPS
jgi:hypothetical protein